MNPDAGRQRPAIPEGYGIHTDDSGMLSWERTVERLTEAHNYWVITANGEGAPHAIPVWGVWLAGAFWFSSDPASRKARNMVARPEVVVHLESGDDVVILYGTVERVLGGEAPPGFASDYRAKYDIEVDLADPKFALFRVAPRRALAWLEADYPATATAWDLG